MHVFPFVKALVVYLLLAEIVIFISGCGNLCDFQTDFTTYKPQQNTFRRFKGFQITKASIIIFARFSDFSLFQFFSFSNLIVFQYFCVWKKRRKTYSKILKFLFKINNRCIEQEFVIANHTFQKELSTS